MSCTEDSEQTDWKDRKSIKRDPSFKQISVQKFCEKWIKVFEPWLKRCTDNPDKPFCRACRCRLDCNRCHLQRHERTTKHRRNLRILIEKGEDAAIVNFKMRQERNKYYQRKRTNALRNDSEIDSEIVKEENREDRCGINDYDAFDADESCERYEESSANSTRLKHTTSDPSAQHTKNGVSLKKERMKLYMQIQKDKTDLMKTFRELIGVGNNVGNVAAVVLPKEKNHIDLFFESVSSSVKALSPKLIAEAKMRVSQLIGELELRGLSEKESNNSITENTIVISPSSGNSYILQRTLQHNVTEQNHEEPVSSQDFIALT